MTENTWIHKHIRTYAVTTQSHTYADIRRYVKRTVRNTHTLSRVGGGGEEEEREREREREGPS
jgi:hypothetical protein